MLETALIVSRWLQFAAAAILCGAPAFALYGLRPEALHQHGPWLKRSLITASALGLLAAIAMLFAQSAEMAGDPALAFDPATVSAVSFGTYFGAVWIVRLVLLLVALSLSVSMRVQRSGLTTVALTGVLLAASLAWMGHGGEGDGLAGVLHRPSDVLHLIAAAAWIGALIVLTRLLMATNRNDDAALHALVRFSGIGPLVVATLIATGLINAWALAGSRPILEAMATPYAFALYVKLALFAMMLILAALNRYQLTPKLEAAAANADARQAAVASLRRSVMAETILAALVIGAVAVLGVMEPPSAL